jgi:ATP-dependent helicase/nuclease subunit A
MALAEVSPALERARRLLQQWSDSVGVLPVHDLLDRIFDAADLRARYAACMPSERVFQVQANLDAFLQLALTLDAGRFPTLTRFLDDVRWMRERDTESTGDGLAAADGAAPPGRR